MNWNILQFKSLIIKSCLISWCKNRNSWSLHIKLEIIRSNNQFILVRNLDLKIINLCVKKLALPLAFRDHEGETSSHFGHLIFFGRSIRLALVDEFLAAYLEFRMHANHTRLSVNFVQTIAIDYVPRPCLEHTRIESILFIFGLVRSFDYTNSYLIWEKIDIWLLTILILGFKLTCQMIIKCVRCYFDAPGDGQASVCSWIRGSTCKWFQIAFMVLIPILLKLLNLFLQIFFKPSGG